MNSLSIVHGIPLSEEPGLGALTICGYLKDVTRRYAEREALVLRTAEGVERWSYADLWERSVEVARALLGAGVGKDSRVGVLMTNRPEFLAAVFGVALSGGVAVPLSTFSTAPELEYLLQTSAVSMLLFESRILNTDFARSLAELEPAIRTAKPGSLATERFPYLRRLITVGANVRGGALESWSEFLSYAQAVPRLMQAEKVNLPLAWPHQWSRLAEAHNWNQVDLSSVRYIERASALARHPTIHSDWREPKAYGVTETFTINVAYPASTPAQIVGESYGQPLPGNTLKIVDPLTGAVRPRGQRGEIAVKGPTLMRGYIGVPVDETLDEEGYFHTGDGGYVNEAGWLFWEGRLTEIIKTGGANVSPVEVDLVLNTCPGIKVGQTVGVPHETMGELVVACAVAQDGAALDEASVREFLRQRLASYKVPRRVLFFREGELSMTGSAKVKANALRELVARRLSAEDMISAKSALT